MHDDLPCEKIHLIGIGGIGMSSLAILLVEQGYSVSGSDANEGSMLNSLKEKGVDVFVGHRALNIPPDVDKIVYSSAIADDNPEMLFAHNHSIQLFKRAEMLALLHHDKMTIAVTGTHGKSTTTGMTAFVFDRLNFDPSISLGANFAYLKSNAKKGLGEHFIVEADESDGSFVYFSPSTCVITNIEMEHIDYYKDMNMLLGAFRQFIGNVKKQGLTILCTDCQAVKSLVGNVKSRLVTYGLNDEADITAKNITFSKKRSRFEVYEYGKFLSNIELSVPGVFNVLNALSVIAICLEYSIAIEDVAKVIKDYTGVKRRFEEIAHINGIIVIDDYAHHPTEIKAVLEASKRYNNRKRIIAVFQPHRYTRLQALFKEFSESFFNADKVFLMDVFAASELPIESVSSQVLFESLETKGVDVYYPRNKELLQQLVSEVDQEDIVVFLGAGDITYFAKQFVNQLKESYESATNIKMF